MFPISRVHGLFERQQMSWVALKVTLLICFDLYLI